MTCTVDAEGREVLHEKPENMPELKIVAGYGAYTEHILYYIVEADDYDTVEKFLKEVICAQCKLTYRRTRWSPHQEIH